MITLSPSSNVLLNPSYFRPKRVKLAFERKKKKRKSFEKKLKKRKKETFNFTIFRMLKNEKKQKKSK